MMDLIRSLFGHALKTNEHLFFAVLTGCLRVAKESIFTGLNNFKVMPITNCRFDEHFGFTDTEVKDMLEYYGLGSSHALIKEWYDGYCFGKTDVYCPWDVLNYTDLLLEDPNAPPEPSGSIPAATPFCAPFLRRQRPGPVRSWDA